MPTFFATKQVAKRLCVHPATLRRWAVAGKFRFEKVGVSRAIPADEVKRLLRGREKKAAHGAGGRK
jgi:excisionase family DNA binding protein